MFSVLKLGGAVSLIGGLMFSSGVFTALLYGKITGELNRYTGALESHEVQAAESELVPTVEVEVLSAAPESYDLAEPESHDRTAPDSIMLSAPVIRQNPELPRGCEITSLTMLLQFYGHDVTKMELLPKMKMDPTPIVWNPDGSIQSWGNPNVGFVGDITLKAKGFGIYHKALFPLLEDYVPSAVDMTGQSYLEIEQRLAAGAPVMVWTTTRYTVPDSWVEWESDDGPVKVTFSEHAVLLVGYDANHVYLNDPLSGKAQVKVNKEQFIASWEALGKQALTYIEPK